MANTASTPVGLGGFINLWGLSHSSQAYSPITHIFTLLAIDYRLPVVHIRIIETHTTEIEMNKITNKKQKLNKAVVILNNSAEELRMIEALKARIGK